MYLRGVVRSLIVILFLNCSIENLVEEVLFLGFYEKMLGKFDILEMK